MAGYSGTPLPRKLGIKPHCRLGAWNAPDDFADQLGALPEGVRLEDAARGSSLLDVIVCFVSSRAELERLFPRARKRLDPNGGLWLCWPKKASGIKTDIGENELRNAGLAASLVDNKVCAISAVWSGLRLVVRVRDRPKNRSQDPGPSTPKRREQTKARRRGVPERYVEEPQRGAAKRI